MNKILMLLLITAFYSCAGKQDAKKDDSAKTESAASKSTGNIVYLTDVQIKNAGIETGKPEMHHAIHIKSKRID